MQHLLKRAWAKVDLDAAARNYTILSRMAKAPLLPVIKADAYGHGAVPLARLYQELGASGFAVSNLEEGEILRRAGITGSILILGYTPPEEAARLARLELETALLDLDYACELSAAASAAGVTLPVHLKLDTGMNRIGFDCRSEDAIPGTARLAAQAAELPGLRVTGAFTHFAAADEPEEDAFTQGQYRRFMAAAEAIRACGVTLPVLHCCNSAGLARCPDPYCLDKVRAGILLYGLSPGPGVPLPPGLTPVMSLQSVVAFVKTLRPGETVGYGRTYRAERPMRVATVSIGYGDGYPRLASNRGQALLRGRRVNIVGRVCMDQLMLDVTDLEAVRPGETVTLFGRDGDAELSAGQVAAWAGTIHYEIVCGITGRIPRVYLREGREPEVHGQLSREEAL